MSSYTRRTIVAAVLLAQALLSSASSLRQHHEDERRLIFGRQNFKVCSEDPDQPGLYRTQYLNRLQFFRHSLRSPLDKAASCADICRTDLCDNGDGNTYEIEGDTCRCIEGLAIVTVSPTEPVDWVGTPPCRENEVQGVLESNNRPVCYCIEGYVQKDPQYGCVPKCVPGLCANGEICLDTVEGYDCVPEYEGCPGGCAQHSFCGVDPSTNQLNCICEEGYSSKMPGLPCSANTT